MVAESLDRATLTRKLSEGFDYTTEGSPQESPAAQSTKYLGECPEGQEKHVIVELGELGTKCEGKPDALHEYEFPVKTHTEMKEFNNAKFSRCALISTSVFGVFCIGFGIGNYYLVKHGYIILQREWECIVFIAAIIQILNVWGLFYELFGEIFCRCCFDKPYVQRHEGVSVLIPAYFPNEKEIIKDTFLHMINDVECDRNVNVTLVYNTPEKRCPEETEMLSFHEKIINGRNIYVIKNPGSTSKAENLNFAMSYLKHKNDLQEYTYIIDADHHPDFNCLQRLVETLEENPKTDCVLGATYIRNRTTSGYGCIARTVDAEFFAFYNLLLPTLEVISGSAFFGGSNGIWRTGSLQPFDESMQTEDIDLSIRSLIDNRIITVDARARSGELIPQGAGALYKQRLRWAVGWNEVTYKHNNTYCCTGFRNFSLRRFFGIFFMLMFRYLAFGFFVVITIFTIDINYIDRVRLPEKELKFEKSLIWLTTITFVIFAAVTFLLSTIRFPNSIKNLKLSCCQATDQYLCIILFVALFPLYLLWTTVLEWASICKIMFRKESKWVVTRRSTMLSLEA